MTRLALLAVASALVTIATLLYALHERRREPEYRLADWDEDDDGWVGA